MLENLTVVIPYFEGIQTIDNLLMSIPREIPVIIVDDCSAEPLVLEKGNSGIRVIRLNNKGYFAGACNRGIEACDTDVLILNQDTWFDRYSHEWLDLLEFHRHNYAMIGERVRGNHPTFGAKGYIHGTFMFLRRDAISLVGLLNDINYPLWGGTAEWQLRAARKGFQVLPLDSIPNFHHHRPKNEPYGSSIKTLLQQEPEKTSVLIRTPPLLSVIIPCYNYGYLLQDCINSLIGGPTVLGEMPGQTLQSFEIIVINDASTDNSAETIDRLAKIEQGIRAYHLPQNVGTAQALNYGIRRAIGKYITFLSADDMREPDSLENLVRCCEENPHSFAYDDIWIFYKHKRIKQWQMEEYDFDILIHKNQIHAGIVFPRIAWEEVGGYPSIMHDGREDWAFNVALGIKGWCGVHVKQFGYLYRREGQNRTETNTSAYHMDYFRDKIRSLFPRVYGGYRPMGCCGKKANLARSNAMSSVSRALASQNGDVRMASNSVGAAGFVRLQYTGKKMSSIWSGHVTNVDYVFGVDKAVGWVDPRDAGERGKKGFLNSKDSNGNFVFQLVTVQKASTPPTDVETLVVDNQVASLTVETEPDMETVMVMDNQVASVMVETQVPAGLAGNAEATGTLSTAVKTRALDVENPANYNVEEIKRWNLTKEGWTEVYRMELADRHRKGLITFLEEKLAE